MNNGNKKELDIMSITSDPKRTKICRKAQKNKNKKAKNFLTPARVKEVLFDLTEISVIVTVVLLAA